ncbi:hypothetical protein [Natronococcus sp. JC468]|uniref:hypothetical protein n=1 Tax=Natronococcus sp. JC468 TaxID=1961921 RepID=UPI001FD7EBA7|nr:hypothetical protein [Natronococcus sp. JC468]
MSERFTITVPEDVSDEIPFDEFDSKSGAIVHHVEKGLEADALEDEIASLEAERDDLRRQLREVNRRNDDVEELVEYIDEERRLQRRREERRDAPVWRRAKWWMFGRSEE